MVLLRKSIPQNRDLQTAAELGVMKSLISVKHLAILVIFFVNGCSSIVTNEPYTKEISNQCFEVEQSFNIYLVEDYSLKTYKVETEESKIRMWGTFRERKSLALTLKKGTEIKVVTVQDYSDGSNGHCWRVFATTAELTSTFFELPTCWSYTKNLWVYPESPWQTKKYNLSLKMNTKYLGKAKACKNS